MMKVFMIMELFLDKRIWKAEILKICVLVKYFLLILEGIRLS